MVKLFKKMLNKEDKDLKNFLSHNHSKLNLYACELCHLNSIAIDDLH